MGAALAQSRVLQGPPVQPSMMLAAPCSAPRRGESNCSGLLGVGNYQKGCAPRATDAPRGGTGRKKGSLGVCRPVQAAEQPCRGLLVTGSFALPSSALNEGTRTAV